MVVDHDKGEAWRHEKHDGLGTTLVGLARMQLFPQTARSKNDHRNEEQALEKAFFEWRFVDMVVSAHKPTPLHEIYDLIGDYWPMTAFFVEPWRGFCTLLAW